MGYYEGQISNLGTSNNGGGWGDSWLGLIALAAIFGWGRNGGGFGFGGGGGGSEFAGYEIGKLATTNDVASGFSTSEIMSDLNNILLNQSNNLNFINQGFAGLNTAIITNGYETRSAITDLGYALKDCCCQTQRAIDGVNYNLATNTCAITNAISNSTRDIIDSQRNGTSAILNFLTNEKICSLQSENTALKGKLSNAEQSAYIVSQLKPCPQPAYVVPNPNCCYTQCGCASVQ